MIEDPARLDRPERPVRTGSPPRASFSLALILVVSGFGCTSLDDLHEVAYPPNFHYISNEEIRSTMAALAVEVEALDQIMWLREETGSVDRERVIEILQRLHVLASQLKRREQSNHHQIQIHAPQLRDDIDRALFSAQMEPPSYYYAGIVAGACGYCHVPKHREMDRKKLPSHVRRTHQFPSTSSQ